MTQNNFPTPNKNSLDQQEQDILKFWNDNKIFEKSVDARSKENEYVFYDGPPFATGMPHYGHFLASIIKDVVPRYYTMKGYRVERTWGWDCHGLPIENIVEEEFGTKSKKDIEDKIGVHKFNEACRTKVLVFAEEWKKIINRLGRWVDFDNGYKTMDKDFMESVMWVFAELHKKGLIYEGRRISLYCPRCATPLSNFEIAMDNSYQMRHDQTSTVKFEILNDGKGEKSFAPTGEKIYLLAWTTTPWTLPSNWGCAVNPDLDYVKIQKNDEFYIVAKGLAEKIFGEDVKIISEFKGSNLVGLSYKPLFNYFEGEEGLHKVQAADFVTDSDGTGIVHLAPYGEDDFNLAKAKGVDIIELETVDDSGKFKEIVEDFKGEFILDKDTNKKVNDWLEERNLIFDKKQYSHSYPHCWRCETPLFYNPQRAYFLDVQEIKPQMLKNNEEINWEPKNIKTGRFQKGLETAPDWNLSRNRFWGSPIPIWKCEDEENCGHQEVMGSVAELEKKCGKKVDDLHKHFVDKLSWDCEKCKTNPPNPLYQGGAKMYRTEEVLDCWFESGSMPYAQKHFPFNEETVETGLDLSKLDPPKIKKLKNFPGDFIAEYIAQTRGWFYTLHVLSTALMDSPSFKNVICTGTILAEDGNKMSKSKKNYPDPSLIFEKYGSDAMRFYLMGSSVMKGENFNFTEKGVAEILKTIILPLKSSYQFFSTYANIDGWKPTKLTFVRHGEGEHNVQEIYSGEIENAHHLTDLGKQQVKTTAENLENFDVLYASPFVRTRETAEVIKNTKNFEGEIIFDKRLVEVRFGDLEGKGLIPFQERYANQTTEQFNSIRNRIRDFIQEISEKHKGKNIVIASHGGPIHHAVFASIEGGTDFELFGKIPTVSPAESESFYAKPNPKTELDTWILSELELLLKNYRIHMDGYEIATACAEIAPFIDKLNNWFLRRSRKRFWATGESEAKTSGYETLFHVLTTLSKILAPIMPFFAEKLWKDLTDGTEDKSSKDKSSLVPTANSVHLELLPYPNEDLIDENISQKIKIMREVVSLSAGIRARKKVKLRQPLAKISFAVSGLDIRFDKSDLEIIKEEANVKEIEILQEAEISEFAQKVVRVNARKVGPKFGKKVQELIVAGKNGDFEILADGEVKIAGEIILADEYEVAFVCKGDFEADSTTQTVVLLDAEISEDLRIEGISREIIRSVQEKRKSDNFEISDRISIEFATESEDIQKAFTDFEKEISSEVLAENIKSYESPCKDSGKDCVDLEASKIEIDGDILFLKLKKA